MWRINMESLITLRKRLEQKWNFNNERRLVRIRYFMEALTETWVEENKLELFVAKVKKLHVDGVSVL